MGKYQAIKPGFSHLIKPAKMNATSTAQGKAPYRTGKPGKVRCGLSHGLTAWRLTKTAQFKNNALRIKKGMSIGSVYTLRPDLFG